MMTYSDHIKRIDDRLGDLEPVWKAEAKRMMQHPPEPDLATLDAALDEIVRPATLINYESQCLSAQLRYAVTEEFGGMDKLPDLAAFEVKRLDRRIFEVRTALGRMICTPTITLLYEAITASRAAYLRGVRSSDLADLDTLLTLFFGECRVSPGTLDGFAVERTRDVLAHLGGYTALPDEAKLIGSRLRKGRLTAVPATAEVSMHEAELERVQADVLKDINALTAELDAAIAGYDLTSPEKISQMDPFELEGLVEPVCVPFGQANLALKIMSAKLVDAAVRCHLWSLSSAAKAAQSDLMASLRDVRERYLNGPWIGTYTALNTVLADPKVEAEATALGYRKKWYLNEVLLEFVGDQMHRHKDYKCPAAQELLFFLDCLGIHTRCVAEAQAIRDAILRLPAMSVR